MSFRGDDQRYGHVPPVQYPVANQQQQQQQQQRPQQYAPPPPAQLQYSEAPYLARRPSFNSGDDTSYFDQGHPTQYQHQPHHQLHHPAPPPPPSQNDGPPVFSPTTAQRFDEELFLSSPGDAHAYAPPIPAKQPVAYGGGSSSAGNLPPLQYQTQPSPSTYNPQVFVGRSQSQALPYRTAPAARLASPALPSIASFQAQHQQQQHQQQQPQSYTPAAYNPAAYAPAEPSHPQRSTTFAGYGGYQHSYSAPAVPQQHAAYSQTPVLTQQSPIPPAQSPQRVYPPPAPQAQQQQYQPGSYYASTPSTAGASPQLPMPYASSTYSDGNYSAPPQMAAGSAVPSTAPGLPLSSNTLTSQAPYPVYAHTPATPSHAATAGPDSFANRAARSNSATSPPPSAHSVSPSPGLRRHPTNAPLPSRPPAQHEAPLQDPDWIPTSMSANEHLTPESLIQDIEVDLGISGNHPNLAAANGAHKMPPIPDEGLMPESDLSRHGSLASATSPGWSTATSGIDRAPSTATTASGFVYETHAPGNGPATYRPEDDSDPEAALGLWEMQQADLDEQRFSLSGPSGAPGITMGAASTPSPYPSYTAQQGQVSPGLQTSASLSPAADDPSDLEFVGMDIGLVSGGYAGNLSYGNDVGTAPLQPGGYAQPPQSTTPRPYEAGGGSGSKPQHYAPFLDAEMDYGGTGGLQAPVVHRLSFDDGDEQVSLHSGRSGSDSPTKDDFLPDMFYHPGLSSRPLPALPPGPADTRSGSSNSNLLSAASSNASRASYQHGYSHSADSRTSTYYSQHERQSQQHHLPSQQHQQPLQPPVERSTSMSSMSTAPVVHVPGRSRTDAAEERRKIQRQQAFASQNGGSSPYGSSYDGSSTVAAPFDGIVLPGGRRKKFVPSKLTPADFDRCVEPWALSDIARWVRDMAEGEQDLKRKTIEEGLVALFTAKVPNMNVADAETLAAIVADSMFAAGILLPDEEWVKFGPGAMSGVLWQLTGSGCYAPRVHDPESPGRCYSYHCTRTLRKANLNEIMVEESVKKQDWVTFYKITKEMMESKPHKEIERQNNLHEIVTGEEEFNGQLDVLRVLFRDQLLHWQPPIIAPNRLPAFVETVFGKVEAMQKVNRDHLLAQLKYRQNEQGPWITGFSGIFREWIRKAKDNYLAYSASYPVASFKVRKEALRNQQFRQFLERVRSHPRCNRLGWESLLMAPITRLQRYSLLLSTVLKNTVQDSEEKANLIKAIDEIRAVTKECDRLVDEVGKKVQLQGLQNQLVFRAQSKTKLNLDHLGRELLMEGDLQRMGSKGVRWVDTHAFLFDHYFILAKPSGSSSSAAKGEDKKYDVSKEPIPMPLLLLESMNDEPIAKQKGLTAPLGRTTAASAADIRLTKVMSNGSGASGRPELEHMSTGGSSGSLPTRLTGGGGGLGGGGAAGGGGGGGGGGGEEGKILYPFRVKHLGHEIYTLYASTPQSRLDWCNKIIEAKTRHARALLEQNAEPFRLRVLADGAFAYDTATALSKQPVVPIHGTPLDRAVREMEQVFGSGRGPLPVCRATVNCAAGFHSFGKSIIAIGTDYGVYISDATNPRGWARTVQMSKVTQIAVLEAFSVCLVLADKALIAYPLDLVAPVSNYPTPSHDSARRAPQRLAKDVSFFATARMKGRTLLFYKRKEGMHNTFRVLEPVFQKASEKKARFFGSSRGKGGAGSTELFRDFDEFYLPTECYSLNLFQTYVAVSTAKGIELLTLDRKQTMSVPRDLTMAATATIAARIRDQRPLGMFRLNDSEFLLAYEDCAVYADKHGEVSRTLIMEYSGKQKKARAATMYGQYLLLFNEDYVEVRNAENGRLRQIIAGHDVRCLDYGFRGPTGGDNATATAATVPAAAGLADGSGAGGEDVFKGTVKIGMTHPEAGGMQIVLELLLNDGHSEKV